MMKKHSTMLIGAFIAITFAMISVGGAFAQAPVRAAATTGSIAFVDLLKFMSKSKKVRVRAGKMKSLQEKKKNELIGMQKKIRALQEELQKQGPMLKEETRKAKERQIQHLAIDLRTTEKQAKGDLERENRENQRIIMMNVHKIVAEIRKQKHYAFIFNQAALLSADDRFDITSEVIKRYDSMPEATAAAPRRPAPARKPAHPAAKKPATRR
jgi:outer membrane protein